MRIYSKNKGEKMEIEQKNDNITATQISSQKNDNNITSQTNFNKAGKIQEKNENNIGEQSIDDIIREHIKKVII